MKGLERNQSILTMHVLILIGIFKIVFDRFSKGLKKSFGFHFASLVRLWLNQVMTQKAP